MQWNETQMCKIMHHSFQGFWLVDTSTGQCVEYRPDSTAPQGELHYDQWLITLAREMTRANAASFFVQMDLNRVCALLHSGAARCTVYYRQTHGPECELTLFYLEKDTHTLAVTCRSLPTDRPGPVEAAELLAHTRTRLDFLVEHVVENFIEVDVTTGACYMLHGNNGMEHFSTLEEQVAWWAEHLIAPEERAAYVAEYSLNTLVNTLRANSGFSCSTYRANQMDQNRTLSIRCHLVRPQQGDGAEYIYAYCMDISQYTEQEQRNKQLIDISQQLLTLSQTESLTGLYNRTAAEKFILDHMKNCRQERTGTLLLFDIDHFKDFNDRYGHQVGDVVLKFLSKSMQDIFRSDDILSRWGGDEFMVFMRDVSRPSDVESRVQRLRVRMQQCERNGSSLHVTISVGGAVAHRDDGLKSLFGQCDQMLYQVKNQGRDGFLLFQGDRAAQ